MRQGTQPGDTLYFSLDGVPHRAEVKRVLFEADTCEPDKSEWREVDVFETHAGSFLLRDRVRRHDKDVRRPYTAARPTWLVCAELDALVQRLDASDPLHARALRALEPYARAKEV